LALFLLIVVDRHRLKSSQILSRAPIPRDVGSGTVAV
jgi:hypothetical protein